MPYCCGHCGGVFDYDSSPEMDREKIENDQPGMWRYRHSFELFPDAPVVSLGEGGTPLIWERYKSTMVGLKMESQNPTGSHKDRGTAVLVSQLRARGVTEAIEDSSGNAGASFAAYAARCGMKAKVFVPSYASGTKRRQIEAYGAELVPVEGPREASTQAVFKETAQGKVYASHGMMPFGTNGLATISYEIFEQAGEIGTIVAPVGSGGLMMGIVRGFSGLHRQGLITKPPYFVGVQPEACSPLVVAFKDGLEAMERFTATSSIAEGTLIRHPMHGEVLLAELSGGKGEFIAVEEEKIGPAHIHLARHGFYVEPTSALAWAALEAILGRVPEPIVLIMTGSGLKYSGKT